MHYSLLFFPSPSILLPSFLSSSSPLTPPCVGPDKLGNSRGFAKVGENDRPTNIRQPHTIPPADHWLFQASTSPVIPSVATLFSRDVTHCITLRISLKEDHREGGEVCSWRYRSYVNLWPAYIFWGNNDNKVEYHSLLVMFCIDVRYCNIETSWVL